MYNLFICTKIELRKIPICNISLHDVIFLLFYCAGEPIDCRLDLFALGGFCEKERERKTTVLRT